MNPRDPAALPQRLKLATREWHARAERSGVMAELLARRLPRTDYLALLHNLHAIYRALEAALDRLAVALPPALRRAAALEDDLQSLQGEPPVPHGAASQLAPAAAEYAARLDALVPAHAHLLLAHAYVRYLGDLHGGQLLRPLVRGLLALPAHGHAGTRFYDFGDAQAVSALRTHLRDMLATAPLGAAQAQAVLDEAVWSFEAHCRLFEQLHAPAGAACRSAPGPA